MFSSFRRSLPQDQCHLPVRLMGITRHRNDHGHHVLQHRNNSLESRLRQVGRRIHPYQSPQWRTQFIPVSLLPLRDHTLRLRLSLPLNRLPRHLGFDPRRASLRKSLRINPLDPFVVRQNSIRLPRPPGAQRPASPSPSAEVCEYADDIICTKPTPLQNPDPKLCHRAARPVAFSLSGQTTS